MSRSHSWIERLFILVASLSLLAAGPASRPVIVLDQTLVSGQYHLASPPSPEWSAVNPDPTAESITFLNTKHDGAIQIILLPKDARVDSEIAGNVAVAIIKELKRQRTESKTVMVMAPKLEKDKRFAIVVHEKYKVADKTADQLHIYKAVGPRVLMLTVNSVSDDASATAATHSAGEAALDSAKFDREAFKKLKSAATIAP